jgi:hypothetical protein
MAVLRRAGAATEGRIGDESAVQAVIDTVTSYPASRVTLIGASSRSEKVAAELATRLTVPFMHLRGVGVGTPLPAAIGFDAPATTGRRSGGPPGSG